MCDMGDRFRLVGNIINVVPPDEELTALPVASAVWEPAPDLPTSAECWLMAGGPHHTVLSTALDASTIDQFAELTRTELVMIDAASTAVVGPPANCAGMPRISCWRPACAEGISCPQQVDAGCG